LGTRASTVDDDTTSMVCYDVLRPH
jgi:hypothetical protein